MILDNVNRKLQVVLTAAKTTLDMPVIIDYVDNTSTTFTPGTYPSNTNGVTLVDILPAPAASTQRKVNSISIYNYDTAAKVVRVYLNDNGTSYQILDLTLQIDDTLCYTDTQGWYAIDSSGNLKSVQAASATAIATAIHGSTDKTTPVGADELGIWDSITGLLNKVSFANILKGAFGTTTNDNAQAGCLGEYVTASIAYADAVSITNSTATNITSISLTAGDWDVCGVVGFAPSATTSLTAEAASIGITSATLDLNTDTVNTHAAHVVGGGNVIRLGIPPVRISINATTTVYLVGYVTFTISTCSAYGIINARRMR